MRSALFLFSVLAVVLSSAFAEWVVMGPAFPQQTVTWSIVLKHRNIEEFESLVLDHISNPQSPLYAHYLSNEQILDMIAPPSSVSIGLQAWIKSNCYTPSGARPLLHMEDRRDAIKVTSTVECAEKLFQIELYRYVHLDAQHVEFIRRGGEYADIAPYYPPQYARDIAFISGLSGLPPIREPKLSRPSLLDLEMMKAITAPEQDTFNFIIPQTVRRLYNIPAGTHATNPKTTQAAIEFLPVGAPSISDLQQFSQESGEVFNNITTIIGPWDEGSNDGESTLDVQYLTTIGAGANSQYITISNGWMYDFAAELFSLSNPPLVSSISYGWPEELQCGSITNANCSGITNAQYIVRANTEFGKVAAKGLSVLVAAQDEGAPSEANDNCYYDSTHPLWPIYPAASPFVTTVSATTLIDTSGTSSDKFISALPPICNAGYTCDTTSTLQYPCMENNTYYTWTTGGGFSWYTARPSYQNAAVTSFLASNAIIPPSEWFNSTNRGYPDISALGSRILIIQSGQVSVTAGTSASTPIIAGIISLLNDYRLNNGKAPLGFLNTMLYQMAAAAPSAFTDITVGNNRCTIGSCCEYGYGAAWGWDPVTGLGTPNYQNMLAYIKTLP